VFDGSAEGTYYGVAAPTGFIGDFIAFQKNEVPQFTVGTDGDVYVKGDLTIDGSLISDAVEADLSGVVLLAPDTVSRNLIQPSADANYGLRVRSHSATQSVPVVRIENFDGSLSILNVREPGNAQNRSVEVIAQNTSDIALFVQGAKGGFNFVAAFSGDQDNSGNDKGLLVVNPPYNSLWWYEQASDVPANLKATFSITPLMLVTTDAGWTSETKFRAHSVGAANGNTALTIKSIGTGVANLRMSVFDATPVAIASSTADLKDSWCAFGFQTNGGATPLNLDGGTITSGQARCVAIGGNGALVVIGDSSVASNDYGLMSTSGVDGTGNLGNGYNISGAGNVNMWAQSSVNTSLRVVDFVKSAPVNVAASYTGLLEVKITDNIATRTCLTLGANGSAPIIGLFGVTPVVRQANASQAGISGIRTDSIANAVADITVIVQAYYDALKNIGVCLATA
jgi:hypothetical protein